MQRGEQSRERILAFVVAFSAAHGYSPTVREIAEAVGLGSTTVHQHLLVMIREGRMISDGNSISRTWRVAQDSSRSL